MSTLETEHASVFGLNDSMLEGLLNQARETIAQKNKAAEAAAKKKEGSKPAALAVSLRFDAGVRLGSSELLQTDETTGMTRLNTERVYDEMVTGSTSGSGVDAVVNGAKAAADPTVKHKSKKEIVDDKSKHAGKKWFGMKAPVLTPELKNDVRVLQLRNVLDPKRFYKKDAGTKKIPKYFEMGTVIEGPTEFYSARMTKKERKTNLVDELLADKQARDYFKRKVGEIHTKNNSGLRGRKSQGPKKFKGGNSKK
ncbi:rrna-processing protein fcf2 [Coemansia interrupta]|uniref:Rrna-processing protein fcf2 n=1 Tax=Coemansia interrupta TaxID=1126814 RepID=A0A9W8LNT1_9FUNG|nr:rrna-processing protein fcf2 [Coemansia interrupta]